MSRFAFCFTTAQQDLENLSRIAKRTWRSAREFRTDEFVLLAEEGANSVNAVSSEALVGAIVGYVRHEHHSGVVGQPKAMATDAMRLHEHLLSTHSWPLGSDWTGTFAAVSFDKKRRVLILCNDTIGYFPIYFAQRGKCILVSTSLVVMGRFLSADADPVGVAERIAPGLCNYGRRTILKGVSRLLPGEWQQISLPSMTSESRFDNSLYRNVQEMPLAEASSLVWDCLAKEVSLACSGADRVSVAMSGGWDSRHILGAVPRGIPGVTCYTYGDAELYETKLAKRCADSVGAEFQCFGIQDKYFPSASVLRKFVEDTESAQFLTWLPLLEGVGYGSKRQEVCLLGDMCESIMGRNIVSLSSRAARKRTYLLNAVGVDVDFQPATEVSFATWKEGKKKELLGAVVDQLGNLAPAISGSQSHSDLAAQVASDLELSFQRVQDNMPPFVVLFDELFGWFHKARFPMAGQCLLVDSTFSARCPPMAIRFLRTISTVHPRLRLQRRLMTGIARLPNFKALSSIPSAQIPWLGARAPLALRLGVWGLRSVADQFLIRHAMRAKQPHSKQRILRSLDYMREYRKPGVTDTVSSWFSGNWIAATKYVELARARGALEQWPLVNVDIAAPANISNVLDLAHS